MSPWQPGKTSLKRALYYKPVICLAWLKVWPLVSAAKWFTLPQSVPASKCGRLKSGKILIYFNFVWLVLWLVNRLGVVTVSLTAERLRCINYERVGNLSLSVTQPLSRVSIHTVRARLMQHITMLTLFWEWFQKRTSTTRCSLLAQTLLLETKVRKIMSAWLETCRPFCWQQKYLIRGAVVSN